MKLWMSGENEADIGDDARVVRNAIEPVVNQFMEGQVFSEGFEKWAFMTIILSEKFISGFPEVAKVSSKGKVLEFRLRISHDDFKMASSVDKISMTIDALERSVGMMSKLKVSVESQRKFHSIIDQTRQALLSD
ncbi:Imm44 family immunity protein [Burkholderia gladioli]|uniref:Imm44 family immunity protein n=1 Tax=Burkholderia gladioli TaxID=28095 RepID=UPI0016414983|nr:Imm44 family immunity protein [Burkholderia gladioli]